MGSDLVFSSLLPPLLLLITAAGVLLGGLYWRSNKVAALVSLLGIGYAFLASILLFAKVKKFGEISSFGGRYVLDNFSLFFCFIILLGAALAVLISFDYLQRSQLTHLEYYPLVLLSVCGAVMMAFAKDLIVLVIALEIMSLAVYVLSAWTKTTKSAEASIKYFLLGAFASTFFIYGIALAYGATGSLTYGGIITAASGEGFNQGIILGLGLTLILAALGFKAALVPFHQWAPDVYTGAPTPITAFMSVVVKAAAFAALLRFTTLAFPTHPALLQAFILLVVLTLIIANLVALEQTNLKRMLAYSAVAHAGYLGIAVIANSSAAILWYLTVYTFMNIGAFAVLTVINDKGANLANITGLGKRYPFLALTMSIFLLSLAGIPPFTGFFAKVLVFQSALQAGYIWLVILGVLTSIIAVIYYMHFIVAMYSLKNQPEVVIAKTPLIYLIITITALFTVLLGILPTWWYSL